MNIQQMSYNTQADWMITVIAFKCIHPYFWMNKVISCKRYKSLTTIEKVLQQQYAAYVCVCGHGSTRTVENSVIAVSRGTAARYSRK